MKLLTEWNFDHVIKAIDLSFVNKLLDVGGGDGSLAIGLAKTNHNTQFGIYEIEKVKEFSWRTPSFF